MAEEHGIGRGRVAELGACMADLIASDFEALEAAGLRYVCTRGEMRCGVDTYVCAAASIDDWVLLPPPSRVSRAGVVDGIFLVLGGMGGG